MSTWAIIIIALCGYGIVISFFRLIKDIIVAKHVANNLEILGAIFESGIDEETEHVANGPDEEVKE